MKVKAQAEAKRNIHQSITTYLRPYRIDCKLGLLPLMSFQRVWQEFYPRNFPRLLRLGGHAKRKEQGAKRKDSDFSLSCLSLLFPLDTSHSPPLFHLIILSALASTLGGIVRPICLAVFRLMTSSILSTLSAGRSAGLAPLRIFRRPKRRPGLHLDAPVGRLTNTEPDQKQRVSQQLWMIILR